MFQKRESKIGKVLFFTKLTNVNLQVSFEAGSYVIEFYFTFGFGVQTMNGTSWEGYTQLNITRDFIVNLS
jgi:hypothetical protein